MSADGYFEDEAEVSDEEFKASSDEEDEEDEDDDKNLDDLIDDNPVEEEDDDDDDSSDSDDDDDDDIGSKKRKRRRRSIDDRLEDEDYDLIEENLGVKVERKKFRRVRQISSDDESAGEDHDAEEKVDDREAIANELFEGAEEEEEDASAAPIPAKPDDVQFTDLGDSGEESEEDDFIVDDDGQPIRRRKDRKRPVYQDSALQEAQDIFGIEEFDFGEFEKYGDGYEEEDEDEYEEYEEEEDETEEVRPRVKKVKKKTTTKDIFKVFEPSELERGYFTDLDREIRTADIPERFQLRSIPVRPTEDGELDEEAEWIYKHAFMTLPVTQQDISDPLSSETSEVGGSIHSNKGPGTVSKIKEAVNFIRNQQIEVPFIAFYRKEYVEPELNIYDLWKIYHWDEKWTQLRTRKQNLKRLFEKMQNYQFELIPHDADLSLPDSLRPLTESDMERLEAVQTHEELRDVYMHFLLYYGKDIPKMQNTEREKKKKARAEGGGGGEGEEATEPQEDVSGTSKEIKQAARKGMYGLCEQAGLDAMAKKFGLTPDQFGENLRDNYQRHDTEQYPAEPTEVAQELVCPQFATADAVIRGVRYMVAMQLAQDPLVRQCVRETYYERAKISVTPTKKGIKEIDENHNCFAIKYLKQKPVKDLPQDQYLKIHLAMEEGLVTTTMGIDLDEQPGYQTYFDEIKQLYYRDEFSRNVQEWNNLRAEVIKMALTKVLYPQLEKELCGKILQEAKDGIIKSASRTVFNWIKVAPYQADQQMDEDDEFLDGPGPSGLKVLGIAYSDDKSVPAFGALIDGDGEVQDFLRLPNIILRRNSYWKRDRDLKVADMEKLKNFIAKKRPHVIAVGAESRDALNVIEDVKQCISELESEQQMAPINVELIDNNLAVAYANSKMCEGEFRDYPTYLRQALSIARRLQDPLTEFSRLCNQDEDILCLRMHSLQDQVSKEDLLYHIYLEFVFRTNETGVDVNRAINHPHTQQLIQFVCGLGPRKGLHLIRQLKSSNMRLENRTQLVTACHMGPKVFINSAGFIKIDTNAMGDSTDSYIEVLDGSRVHPETYEWARKMAVDALEYDESAEENNPAGALDEILENPDKLKDLDLDAFAEELERQGYGNKGITLYDIRAELNCRYKDLRVPYHSPTSDERFSMLTKETPETFFEGKMILCKVTGFAHRRPRGEQLDQADPVQIPETRLWQCPFCLQDDFPDLTEVWSHFDGNKCPGQTVGVRTRLDNGVGGFIPTKMISDKHVKNPEERVQAGMSLHCRITKIDIEKIQVDLTCRSSDLADKNNEWLPPKDDYYDHEAELKTKRAQEDSNKKQNRRAYVKRVIVHPSFHNIDYKQTEKLMESMEQGEVIVRPSSKGQDHLTVTWKVDDGIYQHIDVKEEGKENAFSLGSSLLIGGEEFEDLDEIIARHIQPMASFVRDVTGHKYFRSVAGGKKEVMEKMLYEEKKKYPSKIPYFMSLCKAFPGKFLLSYQPRVKQRHEYVTVTPDGFRYRQKMHSSLNGLLRWFKEHFRDPIPGAATPSSHTPMSTRSEATPSSHSSFNLANVDTNLLQKAISAFPSQVYSAIANMTGQTASNQTPQILSGGTFGSLSGYRNQPFATPQNPISTPLMTPSYPIQTPQSNQIQTPQYQPTPRQNWSTGGATTAPAPAPAAASSSSSSVPAASVQNVQPVPTIPSVPRQVPARSTPQRPAVTTPVTTDWAKAAAQWAKKRAEEKTQPSPMITTPAAGDATPLIDEQER